MQTVPSKEEMLAALELKQGAENQKKISAATVAVCGLGGLGSNIALSLARAGVGKLILIDFDRLDITNLHRQQYKANQLGLYKADALKQNLLEVAPYVEYETHAEKITPENVVPLLEKADVICEAFDKAEAKSMLVNEVLEKLPQKCLVARSGMAGIAETNLIKTRKLSKRFFLCGDGISNVDDGIGLVSSRVMVCAAHQAHTVIRIITGMEEV